MTDYQDAPRDVREGESLDMDALRAYLTAHPDAATEGFDAPLSLRQFPSGHSNLTYLLKMGERELILRRPPFGAAVKTGHDMSREFNVLSGLHNHWPKVPRPVLLCEDKDVIGAPFYLMSRVEGVILRASPKGRPPLTADDMALVSRRFVDTLVEIHDIDVEACGLERLGRPVGYVSRQIAGWTLRYQNAQTDAVPAIEAVMKWLAANQPEDQPGTLIHNDFKYDNLVLDPDDFGTVRAVLDWEMCTLGDPMMDLGTSLGYWMSADDPAPFLAFPFVPTMLPGNMTRDEVVARYVEATGRDSSNIVFYYVQALFKIAVIAQQIYKRYKLGQTRDERFAMFGPAVHLLAQGATAAIDKQALVLG